MKPFPTKVVRWLGAFNDAIGKSPKLADIRKFLLNDKSLPKVDPVVAAGVWAMIAENEIEEVINANKGLEHIKTDYKAVEFFLREVVERHNKGICNNNDLTSLELKLTIR